MYSKVTIGFADNLRGVSLEQTTKEALCGGLQISLGSQGGWTDEACIAAYDDNLFELWAEDIYLFTALEAGNLPGTSEERWIYANIERAIPDLREATSEHFIPQMCNMQAVEGVSFSKGCYTGQEIVTRLQHRGILKKAMYRFSTDVDASTHAGGSIVNDEGLSVGEVVLTAKSDGKTHLLAVIQQAQIDTAAKLSLESGEALSFQGLPYELDPHLFESKR